MRRDSIFYKLFQQSPATLFELVPDPPANAEAYRFDSVAVKEPKFEIDGVFLPPEDTPGAVYFCEVQSQKDEQLYERIFAKSSLYFYRNRSRFNDWQAVVIYPSRSIEQSDLYPHRGLLNSDQLHRVYLDELGDIRQLPLWVGLMVLTTVKKTQAPAEARYLINQALQTGLTPVSRAIIEVIATIISYRFETLSQREVEVMLDITIQETRIYREIKEEAWQEGRQEGQRDEAALLVSRLLEKRFGKLSEDMKTSVTALPVPGLEALSEALLDFTSSADLPIWLAENTESYTDESEERR